MKSTTLFSLVGIELLRRYKGKHPSRVNLEDLDFEEVDKEIKANETAQAIVALEENALEGNNPDPEDALVDTVEGDEATT